MKSFTSLRTVCFLISGRMGSSTIKANVGGGEGGGLSEEDGEGGPRRESGEMGLGPKVDLGQGAVVKNVRHLCRWHNGLLIARRTEGGRKIQVAQGHRIAIEMQVLFPSEAMCSEYPEYGSFSSSKDR